MVVLLQSICLDPLVTVMCGFNFLSPNFSLILSEFGFVSSDFIFFSVYILKGIEYL